MTALQRDKENRGYYVSASSSGMHHYAGRHIDEAAVRDYLTTHYNVNDVEHIISALGVDESASGRSEPVRAHKPEPEPEIERDESWGSW